MFGFFKKPKNCAEQMEIMEIINEQLKSVNLTKSKCELIITDFYRRHGITVEKCGVNNSIPEEYLAFDTIEKLLIFTKEELTVLYKVITDYILALDDLSDIIQQIADLKNGG